MDYHLTASWVAVLVAGALWDLTWRGLALWRAANHGQRAWFFALLIVNSIGILPIIYLLMHRPTNYMEDYFSEKAIPVKG